MNTWKLLLKVSCGVHNHVCVYSFLQLFLKDKKRFTQFLYIYIDIREACFGCVPY